MSKIITEVIHLQKFFQIYVSLHSALQLWQCHSYRALLWSTRAEKMIDTGGLSTAVPWPSTWLSGGQGQRGTWDHRKEKAAKPPLPVEKIWHPQFPQQWVPFFLKQDVNTPFLTFKSFMNSGIASLTLNSEGQSMLSYQALASIEWITRIILFSKLLISSTQWKGFFIITSFYHFIVASQVLHNKNSYQRKHWCTKVS